MSTSGEATAARHSPSPSRTNDGHTINTTGNALEYVSSDEAAVATYLTGWQLYGLTCATSLVSITNALHGFDKRDWVVTAYLLTYTGFLIIYAKFSDIFGRKAMMILGISVFIIFSIVCGTAQSVLSLIIARAFQGVGGSGVYSMVMVIAPEMVPFDKIGKYMAIISSVFALASILGPLLGGAISQHSTWRWVFLLNVPAGIVATAMIVLLLPWRFPHQGTSSNHQVFSKASMKRLDLMGSVLGLAASVLLVFALEQAGSRYAWQSAAIITTLTLSGLLWVSFIGWEKFIGRARIVQEPIFPLRLLRSRLFSGMLLNACLTGFPFQAVIVNLPQRFQAVNGLSPTAAGIRLLPLLLCSPFASGLSGLLVTKAKVPPAYLLILGSALQLLGVGLTSSLPSTQQSIRPAQYGYEVLMGFGFGLGLSSLLVLVPMVVSKQDIGKVHLPMGENPALTFVTAVAMGAITQIRVLGGTVGLAICATVLNNHLRSSFPSVLNPDQISQISDSVQNIEHLNPNQEAFVRRIFAEGYNDQMRIMTYISAAVFLASLLLLERRPRAP
ncbi:MAG: hypothetical protein Q9202_000941 [Teloschistes flavicans]